MSIAIDYDTLINFRSHLFIRLNNTEFVYLIRKPIIGIDIAVIKTDFRLGSAKLYDLRLGGEGGIHIGYLLKVPQYSKYLHNIICVHKPRDVITIEKISSNTLKVRVPGLLIYVDDEDNTTFIADTPDNKITSNL